MEKTLSAGTLALACCSFPAWGQACEGGVYLNPQVIRGEGMPQVASAASELSEFLGRAGLSAGPVVNVSNVDEASAAAKRPRPPCWVFGNPVVGLGSGYRPVAVNTEEIQSAVLLLADIGPEKDPKPVDLASLSPEEQARVRERLKLATCFGMKSGVTTALVKAEKLCANVVDVRPQTGLGQSYLPTKAAFEWRPDRWIGVITRVQGARSASMSTQLAGDRQIHQARLIVVPTRQSSWGYGLYLRPDLPADSAARAAALFAGIKQPHPALARALDLGTTFQFVAPRSSEIDAMRTALGMDP